MRFFSDGEKHEASQWQDVPDSVEDELRARRLRAGDFHKIPRQRAATVSLVVFAALLALGVVLGIKALATTGRRVETSASELRKNTARGQNNALPAVDAGVPPPARNDSPR